MSKVKEVHIGNRIKAVLKEQGRTTVWLAKQIPCTPNHLYKVYANASINTDLLKRISEILDYNFLESLSKMDRVRLQKFFFGNTIADCGIILIFAINFIKVDETRV